MRNLLASIFGFILFISLGVLLASCKKELDTEIWVGTYAFPTDSPDFPLYMELNVQRGVVSGRAFDGSLEEALINGTIKQDYYSLLLHPLKHGSNRGQDVTYRGQRSGDTINGEWIHTVGGSGPWQARITHMSLSEAMEASRTSCVQMSQVEEASCDSGT